MFTHSNKKYVSLVRSRREKRYEMDQCDTTQLQQRTTLCGRKSSEHQPLFRYRPPKRCSPTTPAARLLCKTQPASSMGAFLCRRYGLLLLLNLNPALFFYGTKMCDRDDEWKEERTPPDALSKTRGKRAALLLWSDRGEHLLFCRDDDDDAFAFDPFLLPTFRDATKREGANEFWVVESNPFDCCCFCCWCLMTLK